MAKKRNRTRVSSKLDEIPEDLRLKVDVMLADTRQRLLEAQAQTEKLIQVVKDNPDADYSEAAILMTMNGLINKVATAEEEFQEMPLDKAGRLIASLSRTKIYKDKVKQDMKKKADIAFQEMEAQMMGIIKNDPVMAEQLKNILTTAKERMLEDD
ncbi:MAG: hypothetical protein BHW44_11115 [Roseburia sp. 40_7]|nr:MAG: hypothetical protein BHW44_11115 [Roseburia sp. 40_7]